MSHRVVAFVFAVIILVCNVNVFVRVKVCRHQCTDCDSYPAMRHLRLFATVLFTAGRSLRDDSPNVIALCSTL